tara:strand:+ start:27 stop:416 length:390 start_codon:yes stop_codon:yes gene_type:complete
MSKNTVNTVIQIMKDENKKYSESRLQKDLLDVMKHSITINDYDRDAIKRLKNGLERCLDKLEELGIVPELKWDEIKGFDDTKYLEDMEAAKKAAVSDHIKGMDHDVKEEMFEEKHENIFKDEGGENDSL